MNNRISLTFGASLMLGGKPFLPKGSLVSSLWCGIRIGWMFRTLRLVLLVVHWMFFYVFAGCVFIGVYSPTIEEDFDSFWSELDDVQARWDLLWCLGGISMQWGFPMREKGRMRDLKHRLYSEKRQTITKRKQWDTLFFKIILHNIQNLVVWLL